MILILISAVIVMCALYVWYVHSILKKEFKDKELINLESEENKSEADIFLN